METLTESMAAVAGYHFGWLDRDGSPTEAGGGKMLRPALALLCARAVRGQAEDGIAGAVAAELVHAYSLLHDDVMDGDRTRHHRPSVWAAFGVPSAVLVGDALLALALRVVAESGRPAAAKAFDGLSVTVHKLIAGQSSDVAFETRATVTVPEYLAMAAGKTGALLGGACALGAQLGGGDEEQIACLRAFGEQLGVAFQVKDDILGIRGDGRATGKPVGSDLAGRKKSLPVVVALASGTSAGEELDRLYRLDRPLTAEEVMRAVTAVETAGGTAQAEREAEWQRVGAVTRLSEANLCPEVAASLVDIAGFVVHRDH
ncbi:polyprenyl synthetase family protein [Amycolatopsis thailandensis]|uniref:polyprenyl synthetase family protein n=1 Tax=Amycolatopsis thailandensis TaxID=589330 RepID=UPI00363CDD71